MKQEIQQLIGHIQKMPQKSNQMCELQTHLKNLLKLGVKKSDPDLFIKGIIMYIDEIIDLSTTKTIREQIKICRQYLEVIPEFIPPDMLTIFVKHFTKRIFDILVEENIKIWCVKKGLIKTFLICANAVSKEIRLESVHSLSDIYLFKLMDSISSYGDFDLQVAMVELVFCIYGRHLILPKLKDLIPESQELSETFANINGETFDEDARKFLNTLNGNSSKIFSILCNDVFLGKVKCGSTYESTSRIWVDFSLSEGTVSWYTTTEYFIQNGTDSDHPFTVVSFFASDVDFVKYYRTPNCTTSIIYIKLKAPCLSSYHKCAKKIAEADDLKLVISKDSNKITTLITKVLPSIFKHKFHHNTPKVSCDAKKVYKPLKISLSRRTRSDSSKTKSDHSSFTFHLIKENSMRIRNSTARDRSLSSTSTRCEVISIPDSNDPSPDSSIELPAKPHLSQDLGMSQYETAQMCPLEQLREDHSEAKVSSSAPCVKAPLPESSLEADLRQAQDRIRILARKCSNSLKMKNSQCSQGETTVKGKISASGNIISSEDSAPFETASEIPKNSETEGFQSADLSLCVNVGQCSTIQAISGTVSDVEQELTLEGTEIALEDVLEDPTNLQCSKTLGSGEKTSYTRTRSRKKPEERPPSDLGSKTATSEKVSVQLHEGPSVSNVLEHVGEVSHTHEEADHESKCLTPKKFSNPASVREDELSHIEDVGTFTKHPSLDDIMECVTNSAQYNEERDLSPSKQMDIDLEDELVSEEEDIKSEESDNEMDIVKKCSSFLSAKPQENADLVPKDNSTRKGNDSQIEDDKCSISANKSKGKSASKLDSRVVVSEKDKRKVLEVLEENSLKPEEQNSLPNNDSVGLERGKENISGLSTGSKDIFPSDEEKAEQKGACKGKTAAPSQGHMPAASDKSTQNQTTEKVKHVPKKRKVGRSKKPNRKANKKKSTRQNQDNFDEIITLSESKETSAAVEKVKASEKETTSTIVDNEKCTNGEAEDVEKLLKDDTKDEQKRSPKIRKNQKDFDKIMTVGEDGPNQDNKPVPKEKRATAGKRGAKRIKERTMVVVLEKFEDNTAQNRPSSSQSSIRVTRRGFTRQLSESETVTEAGSMPENEDNSKKEPVILHYERDKVNAELQRMLKSPPLRSRRVKKNKLSGTEKPSLPKRSNLVSQPAEKDKESPKPSRIAEESTKNLTILLPKDVGLEEIDDNSSGVSDNAVKNKTCVRQPSSVTNDKDPTNHEDQMAPKKTDVFHKPDEADDIGSIEKYAKLLNKSTSEIYAVSCEFVQPLQNCEIFFDELKKTDDESKVKEVLDDGADQVSGLGYSQQTIIHDCGFDQQHDDHQSAPTEILRGTENQENGSAHPDKVTEAIEVVDEEKLPAESAEKTTLNQTLSTTLGSRKRRKLYDPDDYLESITIIDQSSVRPENPEITVKNITPVVEKKPHRAVKNKKAVATPVQKKSYKKKQRDTSNRNKKKPEGKLEKAKRLKIVQPDTTLNSTLNLSKLQSTFYETAESFRKETRTSFYDILNMNQESAKVQKKTPKKPPKKRAPKDVHRPKESNKKRFLRDPNIRAALMSDQSEASPTLKRLKPIERIVSQEPLFLAPEEQAVPQLEPGKRINIISDIRIRPKRAMPESDDVPRKSRRISDDNDISGKEEEVPIRNITNKEICEWIETGSPNYRQTMIERRAILKCCYILLKSVADVADESEEYQDSTAMCNILQKYV